MVNQFFQKMIDNAFNILPDQQLVTLRQQSTVLATGIAASQLPLSFKDRQQIGPASMNDIEATFLLRVSTMNGQKPHDGFIIVDEDGVQWQIRSMGKQMDDTTYRAICVWVRGTIPAP